VVMNPLAAQFVVAIRCNTHTTTVKPVRTTLTPQIVAISAGLWSHRICAPHLFDPRSHRTDRWTLFATQCADLRLYLSVRRHFIACIRRLLTHRPARRGATARPIHNSQLMIQASQQPPERASLCPPSLSSAPIASFSDRLRSRARYCNNLRRSRRNRRVRLSSGRQ
jgi:hypothetical protein